MKIKLKNDKILSSSIWIVAVSIIDKSVSILTQPFINRILSVYENGVYSVFQTYQSILSIIFTFNLFGGVLEVYLTKYNEDKKNVLSSLCSLSLIISSFFILIFFIFGNNVEKIFELKKSYLLIMYLTIISNGIIQFWIVNKRFEYSYKEYSITVCIIFVTKSILSIILAYNMQDRVFGRIFGLLLPQFLAAILFSIFIFKESNFVSLNKYWLKALKFNIPLLPHYLSTILLSSSDRIMIQKFASTFEAGLYTVAYSLSSFCLFAFESLNSAYSPLFYKLLKDKDYDRLKNKTWMLIYISLLFSIIISMLAPEGICVLGGDKYLEVIDIVPVLISGIFLSSLYSIYSNIEFLYEKTNYIFPITIISSLINILLNFILIPIYGYKICAYTTLIGYIIISLLHYYVSKRIIGKDVFESKKIFFVILLFILLNLFIRYIYDYKFIRYFIALLNILLIMQIYFFSEK